MFVHVYFLKKGGGYITIKVKQLKCIDYISNSFTGTCILYFCEEEYWYKCVSERKNGMC